MKNREKILKTSTYDFLVSLNESILSKNYLCVIECILDNYQYKDGSRCAICEPDCERCIQKFLNSAV